jgi:hypothetical protein
MPARDRGGLVGDDGGGRLGVWGCRGLREFSFGVGSGTGDRVILGLARLDAHGLDEILRREILIARAEELRDDGP